MSATALDDNVLDTDTPLQAAVWMAQDLGIDLPPIPGIHAQTLVESGRGQLFCTDGTLLDLSSRGGIVQAVSNHWPVPGLAFGSISRGSWSQWFYTLVGERQLLHVSSRLDMRSDAARATSAAFLNQVNQRLTDHLKHESHYFQAINPEPPIEGAKRRIIVISDDADSTFHESAADWEPGQAELVFAPSSSILEPTTALAGSTEVIFRG